MPKFVPTILAVAVAATLIALSGCSSTIVRAAVNSDNQRKAAPDFALTDSDGKTVHLSDYKGKVVLLDFWATWCAPCKIEIPWFMEFERTYKDKGLVVLGVSMDDDGWKVVKPYLQQMKINYRIALGVVNGKDEVGDKYGGVDSLPTTFLIDRQGRIASTHVGLSGGKDDFQNDIVRLLGTPHAGAPASRRGVLALLTSPN